MNESIFDIINHEDKLKGLEHRKEYPKETVWKCKYPKDTKQDFNIINGVSFNAKKYQTPGKNSSAKMVTERSGIKHIKPITQIRDYNILTNRYIQDHEVKQAVDQEILLKEAAVKLYENSSYDPIKRTYNDTDQEKKIQEQEIQKSIIQNNKYISGIPIALQKAGLYYNVLNGEVKNSARCKSIDQREINRIKRFQVRKQHEELHKKLLKINESLQQEREQNYISFDRFKASKNRGYDIVSQLDFSRIPNFDSKLQYYTQCEKPKGWSLIANNQKTNINLEQTKTLDTAISTKLDSKQDLTGFNLKQRQERFNKHKRSKSIVTTTFQTGPIRSRAFQHL